MGRMFDTMDQTAGKMNDMPDSMKRMEVRTQVHIFPMNSSPLPDLHAIVSRARIFLSINWTNTRCCVSISTAHG